MLSIFQNMQKGQSKELLARVKNHLDSGLVFLVTLFVYILTAARSVTFEDSGLFIMALKEWGVPHPPGYPLYTLLGHLFSYLPISTPAFRISLLSATLGAGAALISYHIFLNLFKSKKWLAVLATLVIAFSGTIWSQMVLAEVYPLHLFLLVLLTYLFLSIRENLTTKKSFIFGLVLGLGFANHWPLLVLSGPAFLFFVKKEWFQTKYLARVAAGFVLGLLPYIVMYFRSKQDPLIAFLGPIESIGDLWSYFMRSYYAAGDKSVLYTWRDGAQFFRYFLELISYIDFSPILVPVAGFGVWRLWQGPSRFLLGYLSFLFLSSSVLLLFFLQLEHNDLNRNILRVFWLGPFFAYGIAVAWGAFEIEKIKKYMGIVVLLLSVFIQIGFNYQKNDLSRDYFAELYGRTILSSLPENSVLFASTDGDVGPVAYVNLGLKYKPSVTLYTGTGVFFRNRVHSPLLSSSRARLQATVDLISQYERVYSIKNLHVFGGLKQMPIGFMFNGLTYEYSRTAVEKTPVPDESYQLAIQALDAYISNFKTDNWRFHRETLAARLCNFLVLRGNESHGAFVESPACLQVLARHQAATGRRELADKTFLAWHAKLNYPVTREKQDYLYHFMVNRLELINSFLGQNDRQMRLLNEGLEIVIPTIYEYPLCDSSTGPLLNSLRSSVNFKDEVLAQLAIFEDCAKKKNDKTP